MTAKALSDDFASGDATRVWSAAWAVIRTHDPRLLGPLAPEAGRIARALDGMELGGALVPNRVAVDEALRRLRHVHLGSGCLCALYPGFDRYDPTREGAAGHVHPDAPVVDRAAYETRWQAVCAECGAPFTVTEVGGYHYPWWRWVPIP